MKKIGVRELRQNASKYLRLVEAGEVVVVTDRGRPVARLVPIPKDETVLERLTREGRITRGKGSIADLPPPLPPLPGQPTPSEILAQMREDER